MPTLEKQLGREETMPTGNQPCVPELLVRWADGSRSEFGKSSYRWLLVRHDEVTAWANADLEVILWEMCSYMVRLFLRSPFWKSGSSGQTHSTRNPNQDRWERRSELGLGKQHSDFRGALEALGPTPEVEQGHSVWKMQIKRSLNYCLEAC